MMSSTSKSTRKTLLIFLYRESLFDLAMSWVLALRANSTMDYPGRIKAGIAIKPYIVKDRKQKAPAKRRRGRPKKGK